METSSNFRGDLEDIVRAGSGGGGRVISSSASSPTSSSSYYLKQSSSEEDIIINDPLRNHSLWKQLSLSEEDQYRTGFHFRPPPCITRDDDYFPPADGDDVFGDPFSNTTDPLSAADLLIHGTNNNINNGLMIIPPPPPPLPYNNSCSSSSSGRLMLETLTDQNSNIDSGREVVIASEMGGCCTMINHSRGAPTTQTAADVFSSRSIQISTAANNNFNNSRRSRHGGGGAATAASGFASYDYPGLSSGVSKNNNNNNGYSCNSQSSMGGAGGATATKVVMNPILNAMNPKVGVSTGCGLIDTTTTTASTRIHEISSSSSPRNPILKRRKSQAKKVVCIPAPAAANSRQGGGEVVPSDLWAWRKYGQKPIKGSPYPRGYYRCSSSKGCSARKQVERSRTDPTMLVITYTSEHNHPWPTQRNALAGSTRTCTPAAANGSGASPPLPLLPPHHLSTTTCCPPAAKQTSLKTESEHTSSQLDTTTDHQLMGKAVDHGHPRLEEDCRFGVSSSGEEEPILFTDEHHHQLGDHDDDDDEQYMPFSSLLMSTTTGGMMISRVISNDDVKKQPFSTTNTNTSRLFD